MSEPTYRGWRALLFYGLTSLIVLGVGGLVIYTFIEKRTLTAQVAPEGLPSVSIVTPSVDSPFCAAWVTMLTRAQIPATLVPVDRMEPTDGLIALCDLSEIPDTLRDTIVQTIADGGGVIFLGSTPRSEPPLLGLSTARVMSDDNVVLAEAATPVLARVQPGKEIRVQRSEVAYVEETPRMVIDGRWKENAHAAVAHYRLNPGRVLWMGFDPSKLYIPTDREVLLMMRTSFRWVAGQPVSEGAIGSPLAAKTLTPAARNEARAKRMRYSVDRLPDSEWFTVRITNHSKERLLGPTVKFWLPPNTVRVELGGSAISRRYVTLTGDPEENAVLISLLALAPNEDRIIKLRAVKKD
jgi:hypothetical protein